MLKQLADWLDDRTGVLAACGDPGSGRSPAGPAGGTSPARCSLAVFLVQAFTGLLLMSVVQPVVLHRLGQRLLHQP